MSGAQAGRAESPGHPALVQSPGSGSGACRWGWGPPEDHVVSTGDGQRGLLMCVSGRTRPRPAPSSTTWCCRWLPSDGDAAIEGARQPSGPPARTRWRPVCARRAGTGCGRGEVQNSCPGGVDTRAAGRRWGLTDRRGDGAGGRASRATARGARRWRVWGAQAGAPASSREPREASEVRPRGACCGAVVAGGGQGRGSGERPCPALWAVRSAWLERTCDGGKGRGRGQRPRDRGPQSWPPGDPSRGADTGTFGSWAGPRRRK